VFVASVIGLLAFFPLLSVAVLAVFSSCCCVPFLPGAAAFWFFGVSPFGLALRLFRRGYGTEIWCSKLDFRVITVIICVLPMRCCFISLVY